MNQETTKDLLTYDDQGKAIIPSGLNVLTILTFIWCAILGLLTLCTPIINKWLLGQIDKAANSGQEIPAKRLAEMEKGKAALELANQNMIPLIAIGMAGVILCFIGALWMRKFKKDGYWMYVAGELAPVLGTVLIMGTAPYSSIWNILFGFGIPILFVVLYTMQRKYLTK
jgi:hypothetical protein